jgi:undecaprenyl-diphosphatase
LSSNRFIATIITTVICLFAGLALLAHRYAYFYSDLVLAHWVQSWTLPGLHPLMTAVSWLGAGWTPWFVVCGTGLALVARGLRLEGILLLSWVGLGAGVNRLLKALVARPRPDKDLVDILVPYPHESFPSGHLVFFIQYFGFLMFLVFSFRKAGRLRSAAAAGLALPIALVGISRVYEGAHWPSDAWGGYLAGSLWLAFMIHDYLRRRRNHQGRRREMSPTCF